MQVTYDALLRRIIEYAIGLGGDGSGNKPFTEDKFLYILLTDAVKAQGPEEEAMIANVKTLLSTLGINTEKGKELLAKRIETETGWTGDFIMRKHIKGATEYAVEKNNGVITVEILIAYIFRQPSSAIKELIEACDNSKSTEKRTPYTFKKGTQNTDSDEADDNGEKEEEKTELEADDTVRETEDTADNKDKRLVVSELTQKVKDMNAELSKRVFGQENAINVFTAGYFQAELLALTDKKRVRPKATYLFAGPPGVGKTFLAENIAELLELPFERFDMSEYSDTSATVEFCGSDNVYKNGKQGNFTSFVSKNPRCVVLFDEIEKAHISVIHLFLQILDAGRIRDNFDDVEISLKDVIMIFTTNAGKQLYTDSDSTNFSTVSRKVILKALQKDVNPATNTPYFPEAICSRFASGNVVMFNHITAGDLRQIARREVLRHSTNFEREIGVKVDIQEDVYTALLFAEGGAADARTVRARSESFFDREIFELYRLVSAGGSAADIGKIDKINIRLNMPEDKNLRKFFEFDEKPEMLLFAGDKLRAEVGAMTDACSMLGASDMDNAAAILRNTDVKSVLIDVNFGLRGNENYLNVEDRSSLGRDFMLHVLEMYPSMPVYVVETSEHRFSQEEIVSYLTQGVRGVISVADGGFNENITRLVTAIHQQDSMLELAKANKIINFKTAQTLSADGTAAEITLFDFSLAIALEAEDSENVLSSISKPNVSFDKVIGAEEAKKELKYFIEYLKNPKRFMGTGVKAPKGVLLYGPPGTGKTMLAKAMASASDVTFITAEGNQFLKRYVGEGPEKVHELFRTARKYAPAILFIDEIDAIAKERTGEDSGGAEETLTAFLAEMDGFKNDPSRPVFVLAATNFDIKPGTPKSLDPALMRRFDRRIYIDIPNKEDRIRFMRLKISSNAAFEISDKKVENLAVRSTGRSLAELESIFEMALRTAIRDGGMKVTDDLIDEAYETFNCGEEKKWDSNLLERTAFHEAGHAVLCYKGGNMPSYITVVARDGHGGYMQYGDTEGKALSTRNDLIMSIRTSLGGRAAELVRYGSEDGLSTGPSGDLEHATAIARYMLCYYGMDEEFGLATVDAKSAAYGEIGADIRRRINVILERELANTVQILKDNYDLLKNLADALVDKNYLSEDQIKVIFEGK